MLSLLRSTTPRSVFALPTAARSFASTAFKMSAWSEKPSKPLDELNTYLCTMPDFEDSKRMDVRPQHLKDAAAGHENGWIIKAGATFLDDTRQKMTGSWFLLREESAEKARERLSKDVYVTGGAWDMSKATITPVAIAKH
ncbi:hypothetical protein JCM8547_002483 [Rhodosporidiobolus lusitaniae]